MFVTEQGKALVQFLQENPDFNGSKEHMAKLPKKPSDGPGVQTLQDYAKMLELEHEALYKNLEDTEADFEVARLRVRLIKQYVETKKAELRIELAAQPEQELPLLEQMRSLDQLLKRNQGV
jgi:hypothetical protein